MSNERMANSITDVPSAIAELLAVNKQLEQELQKTREQLNTCEKLLMRFVPDEKTIQWKQRELDAKQYFKDKDKQGEG